MGNFEIFGLQFAGSLLVYALIARWYVAPRLATMPLSAALQPLLLHHATRTVGMTLLVSAVVGPGVPRAFALQVAYGDLVAAVLALVSIAALRARASYAIALVWIFNIEGFADLLNALAQGIRLNVANTPLGAAWYIPTYAVPALLVTHIMMFSMLLKPRPGRKPVR
ncbi:MAG: hypothetical protein E6H05_05745 [Bacillati bacterium ANGP1]|uniref:Uncharacterized protein n=1 Tax=Candidatus Segetimicrobium genomatis TaxID=2569760 RepID=A0A537IWU2_9BACT|nr:MAG: hypothetical protein E6H05_05745 [Terrabacteria group bacterium ANGP1]